MSQRLAAILALAAFALAILTALVWRSTPDPAAAEGRVSFQIATSGSDSAYFTIGQAVAGLVSHPIGVGRCDTSTVCGPTGVIVSIRTSAGAADNLIAVNGGAVNSAFVQGDMIAQAVAGRGPFRRPGPLRNIRIIAALFAEDMHLVVAPGSGIANVADLRGRRVGFADRGSEATARDVLSAWRVSVRRVESADPAADLAAGKLDAFFVLSAMPVESVTHLLASGKGRLAAISGPPLERLLAASPQLQPTLIAAGLYPGSAAVATISTRAYWVTNARASDTLVYGLARALFNPANQEALRQSHHAAVQIDAGNGAYAPPAPLHRGAERYYREMRIVR